MKEAEPIDPRRIGIARRWSKLEWEMFTKGLTQTELLYHYEKMGLKERKWSSHLEQMKSFDDLRRALPDSPVTEGENIREGDFKDLQAVVAMGGDGHFSFTSHFIRDQLLAGVVGDQRSTGALLNFKPDQFIAFLPRLIKGDYGIQYWTRLQIILDGKTIPELALSEVFVGSRLSVDMSRYNFDYYDHREEEKTSGIVISTGTGSSGWHGNIHMTQQRDSGQFSRNEIKAKFIVRDEPIAELSKYFLVKGDLYSGEELEIESFIDDAVVSPDSYRGLMYDFPAGSRVKIKISENPLRVITPHAGSDRYVYQIPMDFGGLTRGRVFNYA